jgi:hypothetical protein
MRGKTLALGLGLAGTLLAGIVLLQLLDRGEPSSPTTRGPADRAQVARSPDLSRLGRELEALAGKADAADVRRLGAELEKIKASLARQVEPGQGGDKAVSDAHQPDKETAEEQQARYAETIEQSLDAQAVDRTWSQATEAKMAEVIKGIEGVELVAATCKQTVCRVELSHSDPARIAEAIDDLRFTRPFATEGIIIYSGPPEDRQSTLYIAREGYSLPLAVSGAVAAH